MRQKYVTKASAVMFLQFVHLGERLKVLCGTLEQWVRSEKAPRRKLEPLTVQRLCQ